MATAVGSPGTQISGGARCSRCGGLMIAEHCFDILDSTGLLDFQAQRCVQCGDLVDPTILRNRQQRFTELSSDVKEVTR